MSSIYADAARLLNLFPSSERWTQCSTARNEQGEPVSSVSGTAVCWCLLGGIKKTAAFKHDKSLMTHYDIYHSEIHQLLATIIVEREPGYNNYNGMDVVFQWNDAPGRTFDQVQGLLAEAVKRSTFQGEM